MRYLIERSATERHEVEVVEAPGGGYQVRIGDRSWTVDACHLPGGLLSLVHEQRSYDMEVRLEGDRAIVAARGRVIDLGVVDARRAAALAAVPGRSARGPAVLRSPMPGRVVRVACNEGDDVAAGAALVVVEAMKMENELRAPRAGKVAAVRVRAGDPVDAGAPLVELA